jgi:hypothetical protein
MSTTVKPEKIQLTAEEAESLKFRVINNLLSEADKKILTGLISFSIWLGDQINLAKLTIFKLRTLFGIKTEKKTLIKLRAKKK